MRKAIWGRRRALPTLNQPLSAHTRVKSSQESQPTAGLVVGSLSVLFWAAEGRKRRRLAAGLLSPSPNKFASRAATAEGSGTAFPGQPTVPPTDGQTDWRRLYLCHTRLQCSKFEDTAIDLLQRSLEQIHPRRQFSLSLNWK